MRDWYIFLYIYLYWYNKYNIYIYIYLYWYIFISVPHCWDTIIANEDVASHITIVILFFFDFTAALFCPVLSNEVFSVMTYSNAATNGYSHYWLNWPIFFLTNCLVYKMLENKIPFSFSQSLRWHRQIACVDEPKAQIIVYFNVKMMEKQQSLTVFFFQLLQL